MIRLPQFTFLIGSTWEARSKFARALADRVPDATIQDLEEPIRCGTMGLFHSGFNPRIDLTDPKTRKSSPLAPQYSGYSNGDFIDDLTALLRRNMGRDIRSHIWIKTEKQDIDIFPFHIIRDAECTEEIEAFIHSGVTSSEGILQVVLAPFSAPVKWNITNQARIIYLVGDTTEDQLKQLERELTLQPISSIAS